MRLDWSLFQGLDVTNDRFIAGREIAESPSSLGSRAGEMLEDFHLFLSFPYFLDHWNDDSISEVRMDEKFSQWVDLSRKAPESKPIRKKRPKKGLFFFSSYGEKLKRKIRLGNPGKQIRTPGFCCNDSENSLISYISRV